MMRRAHLPTLFLLAAALLLRALVPVGWMPVPGGVPLAVEPCPSADSAAVPMGGMAGHQSGHGKTTFDCFASMMAGAGLPEAPATVAVPVFAPLAAPFLPESGGLKAGPPALPPPATGPPSIA